jgi:hypothetical protein
MKILTRFNIGNVPYIIDNDKIIHHYPIVGITVVVRLNGHIDISYTLLKNKATQLMDRDTIIYRDEDSCYASSEEIIKAFE